MQEEQEEEEEQQPWNKFLSYHVSVDPFQNNRATEISLFRVGRPHMRAFHCSWWSLFAASFLWLSIHHPILRSEIQDDLKLNNAQIWNSSIASLGGALLMRLLVGPLCDTYGPRTIMAMVLCISALPCASVGFIHSARDLYIVSGCIGMVGGTFVLCQSWTSLMFSKEIVGTANGLVGGWGHLGGGVTQLILGRVLLPLIKRVLSNRGDHDDENDSDIAAWRLVMIVPALVGLSTGILIYCISDDTPNGDYTDLKRYDTIWSAHQASTTQSSFRAAMSNRNTWVLSCQYACSFGAEVAMSQAAVMYLKDVFGQSTQSAMAIASMVGWMNWFARAMGGFYSDHAFNEYGLGGVGRGGRGMLQGRLWVVTVLLVAEGIFIFIFSHSRTLAESIMAMIWFSFFV
jgi:MFS transporter, NNP family, nitrate/nitrite transporter